MAKKISAVSSGAKCFHDSLAEDTDEKNSHNGSCFYSLVVPSGCWL